MFEKLIEKISLNVREKIQQDIEHEIFKFVADIIRCSFNNSHALSKDYDSYWGNDNRDIIRNAITEAFNKNFQNQISQEVSKEVAKQMAIINEEEFIDKIVERIQRKQIK